MVWAVVVPKSDRRKERVSPGYPLEKELMPEIRPADAAEGSEPPHDQKV